MIVTSASGPAVNSTVSTVLRKMLTNGVVKVQISKRTAEFKRIEANQ